MISLLLGRTLQRIDLRIFEIQKPKLAAKSGKIATNKNKIEHFSVPNIRNTQEAPAEMQP